MPRVFTATWRPWNFDDVRAGTGRFYWTKVQYLN